MEAPWSVMKKSPTETKGLAPICDAAAAAFEILLRQRAVHGLKNKNSGRYINPDALNKLERQAIRNTFKTIEKIQQTLRVKIQVGIFRVIFFHFFCENPNKNGIITVKEHQSHAYVSQEN